MYMPLPSESFQWTWCKAPRRPPVRPSSVSDRLLQRSAMRVPFVLLHPLKSLPLDEFERNLPGDDLFLVGFLKNAPYRFPAVLAVVERQIVHVHSDEAIDLRGIETPRKLGRIGHPLVAM